ncbi:MAG: flagellar hook-associated protein FlgL [Pirellulales bacterium]|nr:flagellar hook-associated protein FlgL [Pirellulales bacterium]
MAITGVPTTRVSDQLVRQRLLAQLQADQRELFRLQTSASTGRRILLPSEDPSVSLRAMGLQRLIERKDQVQVNLSTNQSFLAASENALSDVTSLVNDVRSAALAATGDQATETERVAAQAEVERAIEQLISVANRTFRGRYLFGGSRTDEEPFVASNGFIDYRGNENAISSLADIGLLLESNVNGHEVFGGISDEVAGSVDLDPIVTRTTRLADLRGGSGISDGSISVAVGTAVQVIDISGAETIGDVADLIEKNAPEGISLTVTVTHEGLNIAADSGALTIKEVGGGTVAAELGILEEVGGIGTPIIGKDLDPRLQLTTKLDDILGSRSFAELDSPGANNAIRIEANRRGSEYDGLDISFVDDPGVVAGSESVTYDAGAKTVQIHIDAGNTTAAQVIDALNADASFAADYGAALDERGLAAGVSPGNGVIDVTATAKTFDGSGEDLDQTSGLRITNGSQSFDVSLTNAETVEDVLNAINGLNALGAAVRAELNDDGTGIDIRSTLSGADFGIGENGGTTASQLGVRSLTENTRLADLNRGAGIDAREGTDFTIRRPDGVELEIDISSAETMRDVLDAVNNHPLNQDGDNRVVASLNTFGNGIEFTSANPSNVAGFQVIQGAGPAASQLGIVAVGSSVSAAPESVDSASVALTLSGANTDLRLTAATAGPQLNGVDVVFIDDGSVTGDNATVSYDGVAGTLTVLIDSTPGSGTTADTIRQRINDEGTFAATLDTSTDPTNDGSGVVTDLGVVGTSTGGTARIAGTDPNPGEVRGIFSALVRLREALSTNDLNEISRSVGMLDEGLEDLNFSRAEIGARQKSVEGLQTRLELEEIDLRTALSDDIDVDLAETISELTARQVAIEASLSLSGSISQLTLLDFI